MSTLALDLYHRLPPFARSAVAGVRGYRLRNRRYGPETDDRVAEILDRDHWTAERWQGWREDRLARLLHAAATGVPYYRSHWQERRRRGDNASWELLENWPLLGKEPVRETPEAFLNDSADARKMWRVNTSGTTGKPLTLYRTRDTERALYALLEARLRAWNDVSRSQPWAVLGGQQVIPSDAQHPPFWVWNWGLKQLYMSANHVSDGNAAAYLEALDRYGATHAITYTSSIAVLATAAQKQSITPAGLRVVITNAEPVHPWQREVIEQGLGTTVRESYGMAEAVAGASECTAGTKHFWPDMGWTEILADDAGTGLPDGETGRLVSTGFVNQEMPLIRYAVGDRGSMSADRTPCPCGRTLPRFGPVEGRTNDLLIAPDGRKVFWLNPVFYGLPVREAQIVQETRTLIRVICVPAAGFGPESIQLIAERMRARMGDVEIQVEQVPHIARGPNGKFRAVISRIRD